MNRLMLLGALALGALAVAVPLAWAGSPHFVDSTVTATRSGDSLIVSGKEAGLGDEAQVHIVVTATALCIGRSARRGSCCRSCHPAPARFGGASRLATGSWPGWRS